MVEFGVGTLEGKCLHLVHDGCEVRIKLLKRVYGLFDSTHEMLINIRRYVLVYSHGSFLCREMADVVWNKEW